MCMGQILKEALDIRLHSNSFSGDADFMLGQVSQPVNNILKQFRVPFSGIKAKHSSQTVKLSGVYSLQVWPSICTVLRYNEWQDKLRYKQQDSLCHFVHYCDRIEPY